MEQLALDLRVRNYQPTNYSGTAIKKSTGEQTKAFNYQQKYPDISKAKPIAKSEIPVLIGYFKCGGRATQLEVETAINSRPNIIAGRTNGLVEKGYLVEDGYQEVQFEKRVYRRTYYSVTEKAKLLNLELN